jgi:predicted ATPase
LIHLREITFKLGNRSQDRFPLNLPVLKDFSKLTFEAPVTIFVGENGSGKSTLLETLALSAGSIAIGSEELPRDRTLGHVQPLVECIKLIWNKRTHRGFFLRAEDFFGYIKRSRALREYLAEESGEIEEAFKNRSDYAKSLAKSPVESSLKALDTRYDGDLGARSHGEGFLTLFQSRFVPDGLYLLDEPEAALSPLSQLGLISIIKTMVEEGGQFIIATHSPILMAIPEAQLLNFDHSPPVKTEFDDLEHVQLYRSFLDSPQSYIDKL